MQFLDINGLKVFFGEIQKFLGSKDSLDASMTARREYLLEIDYEKDLAFNTNVVIGNSTSQLNLN